jgi:SAM-dependent methyltransferase
MLSADGGSFKDPSGRVYRWHEPGGTRVVRGLNGEAAETIERLLSEPFFQRLVADGDVAKTTFLPRDDPASSRVIEMGWAAAVEHEAVEFVTWPYEWPFSMLKDAALLQLRLLDTAVRNGWMLKDATPFNIQWIGARPLFTDVPSFVPWEDGEYWRGYRQFCSTFLTPLMLTAHLGIPFQPLLRSRLDGIPPEDATNYFYGRRRFKRGVLSHVWFPAKAERRMRRRGADVQGSGSRRRQPRVTLLALLDSLTRLVDGLSYGPPSSDWSQYSETHSYDDKDFERKKSFVDRHTSTRRPSLLWDLGANTGTFSRIAARHSRTVVAVDGDQDAVDLLYRGAREGGERNIVPLVMDLANLSPGQGWAGQERAAFDKRRSPDMVLCLALVHHMRVSANVPLSLFVEWLRSLDATAIVEFVGRDDEMFRKLVENKSEDYPDYTPEAFESEIAEHFTVSDRLELKGGKREMFLLEPKPST